MRPASLASARVALAITVCWTLALGLVGSTEVVLFLAPALLIAVPLVLGRYVGVGLIAKLGAKPAAKPRAVVVSPSAPRSRSICLPRGGRLLAFGLDKRPPPARLASLS